MHDTELLSIQTYRTNTCITWSKHGSVQRWVNSETFKFAELCAKHSRAIRLGFGLETVGGDLEIVWIDSSLIYDRYYSPNFLSLGNVRAIICNDIIDIYNIKRAIEQQLIVQILEK